MLCCAFFSSFIKNVTILNRNFNCLFNSHYPAMVKWRTLYVKWVTKMTNKRSKCLYLLYLLNDTLTKSVSKMKLVLKNWTLTLRDKNKLICSNKIQYWYSQNICQSLCLHACGFCKLRRRACEFEITRASVLSHVWPALFGLKWAGDKNASPVLSEIYAQSGRVKTGPLQNNKKWEFNIYK